MDEPLSNLDAALSHRLRREIVRLQAELGFTLIYVTHAREEAQEIGTRVIELGSTAFARASASFSAHTVISADKPQN